MARLFLDRSMPRRRERATSGDCSVTTAALLASLVPPL